MKLNEVRTDPVREKSGVWRPWRGDMEVKLRRSGNPDYTRAMIELLRPYRALIRADAMPDGLMEKLSRKAFAEHVWIGWKNLVFDNGSPCVYSPKQAEEFLNDDTLHDLREFVIFESTRMDNFIHEERQESLGNSVSSSTGSTSGGPSRSSSESSSDKADGSKPSNGNPTSPGISAPPGVRSTTTTKAKSESGPRTSRAG